MHATELAYEGAWLIKHVIGIPGWTAAPVPYVFVEKLLRETAYEELGRVMLYDFHHQQVRVQYRLFETDVAMLNSELRRLSDKVVADDKEIIVDAPSMFALLQHFYGREPSLPLYQPAQVMT